MSELSTIRKQLEDLRAEEHRLEAQNFRERVIPAAQANIGKTFVYRNNTYGSGGHWDTFRKDVAFEFGAYNGWMIFEECQVDSEGRAKLETAIELIRREEQRHGFLDRGWVLCDEKEYSANPTRVLEQLTNPTIAVEKIKNDRL